MAKKFFDKEYDKGTQTKLEIFDRYFNEAFPVFVHSKWMSKIYVCDFFAGKGMDSKGNYGTSLKILESISGHCHSVMEKGKKVILVLNDKDECDALKENVNSFLENCKQNCDKADSCIFSFDENLFIRGNDFEDYFYKVYGILDKEKSNPKIIFIDPFGLVVSDDVFQKLIDLPKTDFICFIPSSFLRRFKEFRRFNEYINLKAIDFEHTQPNQCHKVIAEYFESHIPQNKEYYLSHFSIQKGSNYYGLIFGTNHSLGAEKFLKICWNIDEVSGEADYNINRELCYKGETLFPDDNIPQKIKNLKIEIETKILNGELKTNKQAYYLGLKQRCLPNHVTEILKNMITTNVIASIKTKNSEIHKLEEQEFIIN